VSAPAPFLELRGVHKRFGALAALVGVDLAVQSGEIAVVLGPTGAGKTTLLRTIAGLERPDAGEVWMAGREVSQEPPAARDVALVFQNFSLYPSWSVRRNLEFPLRAPGRRLPAEEIEQRVRWAAGRLSIEHLLERDSRRLSGGEMQRVAIGRAIVRRPRLFLMDEPLTNLDAKLRESLRVELASLVRELGVPMIYVTHDQAEALSMADRILVLAGGRVLQSGRPREVYERPRTPAVARALGWPPMNEIRARRTADGWVAEADGSPLASLRPGQSPGERDGERALLGIRPEHVQLAPDDGPAAPGAPAPVAEVRVVEDAGHQRILVADLAGTRLHLVAPRDSSLQPGQRIRLRLDPEHLVLWDEA